jgi:predicted RNA binding protein YcfA (HicA-like mRNA interferase family)
MSKKLPPASGNRLISLMKGLGYQIVRQPGTHKITVPNHDPIAKGTLSDILHKLFICNQISKEDLIERL